MVMQWTGLFALMVQLKPAGLGSPFSSLELVWPCRELAECTNWEPGDLPDGAEEYIREPKMRRASEHLPICSICPAHVYIGKAGRGDIDPTL